MNKQFRVHNVINELYAGNSLSRMSSSLIDRLYQHHYRYAMSVRPAHAQTKPDDAHRGARVSVAAFVKDFLPPRGPLPSPLLQTCCAATGVTPHSYPA